MKVLVASKRTQGRRRDDFCFTIDGELVSLPVATCDCPDCGCDRAVGGLSSRKGTTTFTVVDRAELELGDYRRLLRENLVSTGWCAADNRESWVDEFIDWHIAVAGEFQAGDVLEIRNDRVVLRARSAQSPSDLAES